jgi:hypothetical protein
MHDLRLSMEEKKDFSTPSEPKAPQYPYGLKITLGPEELKKLGIKEPYEVGCEILLHAKGFVEAVAKEDEEAEYDGQGYRMTLQLTEASVDKNENKDTTAKVLYGS